MLYAAPGAAKSIEWATVDVTHVDDTDLAATAIKGAHVAQLASVESERMAGEVSRLFGP